MSSALTSVSSSAAQILPLSPKLTTAPSPAANAASGASASAAADSPSSAQPRPENTVIIQVMIRTLQTGIQQFHQSTRLTFSSQLLLSHVAVARCLSNLSDTLNSLSQDVPAASKENLPVINPGLVNIINSLIQMNDKLPKTHALYDKLTIVTKELRGYKISLQIFLGSFSQLAKSDPNLLPEELQAHYIPKNLLGKGIYGTVYECTITDKHPTVFAEKVSQKVAVKKITHLFTNVILGKRTIREIKILRMLSHKNIVQLIEVLPPAQLYHFNDLSLVFEHVEMTLHSIISTYASLTKEHIQYFLYQLLSGVAYMHSAGVIHRDLKPENILVNPNGSSLKICDFGLSRLFRRYVHRPISSSSSSSSSSQATPLPAPPSLCRLTTEHVATRWYRAPEVILLSNEYSCPIDVWSIGCIFAEMLLMEKTPTYKRCGLFSGNTCHPLSPNPDANSQNREDQLKEIFKIIGTPSEEEIKKIGNQEARKYVAAFPKITAVPFEKLFPTCDPSGLDLLAKLLRFDPKTRWSAAQALEHPYLKACRDRYNTPIEFDWESYLKNHPKSEWDFESKSALSFNEVRKLLIQEIERDHPELSPVYEPFLSNL